MAQWIVHWTSNPEVAGSNPVKSAIYNIYKYAWMAEWSKAADLSSVIFGCVGSNPTSGKIYIYYNNNQNMGV